MSTPVFRGDYPSLGAGFRPATIAEMEALYNTHGDMGAYAGWPVSLNYVSTTLVDSADADRSISIFLGTGVLGSISEAHQNDCGHGSCVRNTSFTPFLTLEAGGPLLVGGAQQMTATLNEGGGSQNVTSNSQWFISNPSIATIDAAGIITGHSVGAVDVIATAQVDGVNYSSVENVTVSLAIDFSVAR